MCSSPAGIKMEQVSLIEILEAREARVLLQQQLLTRFQMPLICFTMNIAGPVKVSPKIREAFQLGSSLLLTRLAERGIIVHYLQEHCPATGCEGYYVADAPAELLKSIAVDLEEETPLGRLFDMDVLTPEGEKLQRPIPRRCLICGENAAICGRSRAHSVPELQNATAELLTGLSEPELVGLLAQKALLMEVFCTPKPGLVDRRNSGSHRDMDIFTFLKSVTALGIYFRDCAATGTETAHLAPKDTFRRLRRLGKQAEDAMFSATGGVNTHKGAIFTLGLLCGATGRLTGLPRVPKALCAQCAEMTDGITTTDFAGVTAENAVTAGQRLYAQYGITGIRGEAEQGFPAVLRAGLPVLLDGISKGKELNDCGCAALLSILSQTEDTNLIHRSDRATQQSVKAQLQGLLAKEPFPSREALEQLDEEFIQKNLSPGGSADLLAASFFLYFLQTLL